MIGTAHAPNPTQPAPRGDVALPRTSGDLLGPAAAARAAYVAQIKAMVQNGEYRPNLEVVAERLMTDLATPYER